MQVRSNRISIFMASKKYYRRVKVVWVIVSGLVALSMILFLVAPFFNY